VIVEEPFSLLKPSGGGSEPAGDGCYVSATVQNRRYYGLLVDQEALKHASLLWFQEEAGSLDLNRRMKMLHNEALSSAEETFNGDKKRPATSSADETTTAEAATKRIKVENGGSKTAHTPDAVSSNAAAAAATTPGTAASGDELKRLATLGQQRQVQKFRYAAPVNKKGNKDIGYRYLLATFADVASAAEDDVEKAKQIEEACQAGGGYVGKYYYQYEV